MDGRVEHENIAALTEAIGACRLCAPAFAETATGHAPRPVPWLSAGAPILLCGQAPGAKVHVRRRPFDDPSGDRLRDWLGVHRDAFYDRRRFAALPMAFCFPGYDARGADLPPPPLCARTWRARALAAMPGVRLTLLIGGHAQRWHLGRDAGPVARCVRNWRAFGPEVMPLPHPSWRNIAWLRRNPWFEAELVPELRARVSRAAPRRPISILGKEGGVEEHLPEVVVRVLEVARVSALESLLGFLDDACAGFRGLRHDRIDLLLACHVVAEREFRRAGGRSGEATVMGEIVASPDRELEPVLQLEEGNRPVLELSADDAFARESEPVAIEAQRAFQVVDADGQDGDPRLHDASPTRLMVAETGGRVLNELASQGRNWEISARGLCPESRRTSRVRCAWSA